MKYIEDGVNAPSPRVYDAIIHCLNPNDAQRNDLDRLYSAIRETPPPDVCRIICANEGMNEALRVLREEQLDAEQLALLKKLLSSFCENTDETASVHS